jgi:hypothetical protein
MRLAKPTPATVVLGVLFVIALARCLGRWFPASAACTSSSATRGRDGPSEVHDLPSAVRDLPSAVRDLPSSVRDLPSARRDLPSPDNDDRARLATCIRDLAGSQGSEAIFDPAAEAIADATVALGREGFLALVALVEDSGSAPHERALACGLLEALRETDPIALVALERATESGSPAVLRRAATRALAVVAPDRFRARFCELAADGDALVRLEALVGLARGGDAAATGMIEAAAAAPGPGFVRSASLAALYAIDREGARDALERCRERVPPDARSIVSLLLAKQGRRSPGIDADVDAAAADGTHPERRALAAAIVARR